MSYSILKCNRENGSELTGKIKSLIHLIYSAFNSNFATNQLILVI